MEDVTIWQFVTVILIPLFGGAFWVLWKRTDKFIDVARLALKDVVEDNKNLQAELSASKLSNEQRFLRRDSMLEMKDDIISHIDTWAKTLGDRLQRVEDDVKDIRQN